MMQSWFADAKFGVFLHWGIYSAGRTGESWPIFNGEIPYDEYMAQASTLTAARYDPDSWARLFAEAGAKYAVLTTKHHDGFALWPTAQNHLNAVEGAPAGRDLIGPYCEALRKYGLKVGLYFSHLDWSHPDYATLLPRVRQHNNHDDEHNNPFGYPQNGESPERWERFLAFHRAQLHELCTRYQPDLLWFDGDWERDPDQWRFEELREQLHAWAPGVVLNSRLGGHGDYDTPEQGLPIEPPTGVWEFCVTTNDHWGYFEGDTNFKTPRQCLRLLAECAGMGGNLLLNIGPQSDGSLPAPSVNILQQMGRWTKLHGEALYGTKRGLPYGHFYGESTQSADGRTLYLFVFDQPRDAVAVRGLVSGVQRASVLGNGTELAHRVIGGAPWAGLPGTLWVDVPAATLDPQITVIKLELDGPLKYYRGRGHEITTSS